MNRILTLCAGALLLLVTGCDTASTVGPESVGDLDARPTYEGAGFCGDGDPATGAGDYDYCVDLVAGQTQKVGQVYYAYDGTTFSVRYAITEGNFCLDEIHYGAYDELDDIPANRGGNVPPGRLTIGDEPSGCATEYIDSYDVALSGDYYVATHAVVVGNSDGGTDLNCPVIVGIGFGGAAQNSPIWGDLYGVNPNTGANEFIYETGLGGETTLPGINGVPLQSYPNGLAFDGSAYYYATSSQELYSHVPGSGVQNSEGTVGHLDAGATIDQATGTYYYMKQSSTGIRGDDDLIARDLASGIETVVCPDFMLPDGTYDLEYGDLAFRPEDGLIYGSVYLDNEPGTVVSQETRFFSVDPATCDYTERRVRQGDEKLQIAFGSDGVLYGHSTGNAEGPAGSFYALDLANGDRTPLGTSTNSDGVLLQFNDLAPGYEDCDTPPVDFDETAWAFGQQTIRQALGGRRWGWIFTGNASD